MRDISFLGSLGFLGGSRGSTTSAGANLKTSLISWWSLDEASAGVAPVTRNDSHGSNHLTDNNTTASGTGKVSNGADFELDNSEYLSRADNTSLSMGDIDCTFCAWVKFESAPADNTSRIALSKYNSGANKREYFLGWVRNDGAGHNYLRLQITSDGTITTVGFVNATTFVTPSTATWYFVIGWHDATANTINIQVNNGTSESASYTGGIFDSDAQFEIGAVSNLANWLMDGVVDEVAIWKRVLTTAEKTWLYNNGNGRAYSEIG